MKYKFFLFKIIISFALLFYLYENNYLNTYFSKFFEKKFAILFFVALSVFAIFIASLRWWFVLKIYNYNLDFYDIFKITYIGNFFNTFLLGAYGGDLMRVLYIVKRSENKLKISSSVLIDRIFGLVAIFLIIIFFSFKIISFEYFIILLNNNFKKILFFIISVLVTLIIFILILNIFNQGIKKKFQDFFELILKKKINLFICIILSLIIFLVANYTIYLISEVYFEKGLRLDHIFFSSSVSQLANSLPITPGGIGLGEFAFIKSFENIQFEIVATNFANIMIFYRIINIFASLPGLFFFIYLRR